MRECEDEYRKFPNSGLDPGAGASTLEELPLDGCGRQHYRQLGDRIFIGRFTLSVALISINLPNDGKYNADGLGGFDFQERSRLIRRHPRQAPYENLARAFE